MFKNLSHYLSNMKLLLYYFILFKIRNNYMDDNDCFFYPNLFLIFYFGETLGLRIVTV